MKIAVDAMGGDHAPREVVRGAVKAAREFDLSIVLVGLFVAAIFFIRHQVSVFDLQSGNSEKYPRPPQPKLAVQDPDALKAAGAVPSENGQKPSKSKSAMDFMGLLIKEVPKYLSQNDLKGIEDGSQFLEKLKNKLPEGSSFSEAWNKAYEKSKQGEQLNKEGKVEEAKKSNQEVRVEMQKLMTLVAQRQSAQEAQAKMNEARIQVQRNGLDNRNLLFRLSNYEERSADEAFAKNDFAGAAVLYRILAQSYRLGAQCSNDESCVQGLRELTGRIKPEFVQTKRRAADPWLYEYADQIEKQAEAYFTKKEFENAAASYIQAAFLYEKMKEK